MLNKQKYFQTVNSAVYELKVSNEIAFQHGS